MQSTKVFALLVFMMIALWLVLLVGAYRGLKPQPVPCDQQQSVLTVNC